MTSHPPPNEQLDRLRHSFPGRTLPSGFYADFARMSDAEMRGLVDASIISTAKHLNRILEDETLDDEEAIESMIDHVLGYLRLVALGCIAFAPDGIGRVYRVDSPGATPEEEAAIDHRLAAARPSVFEALQQLVNPQ
ncbi:MAG: hypothetical protein MUF10_14595 [Thermoanaerobaculaceae bacterium]|jgi:hypothetical protein|nr:hypothetical protein [Thermoanaerobaculaceae bacterium]